MIRMAVADEDGIDLIGRNGAQQLGQNGVAGIDQQAEAIVFEEVAATRLACCRPAATAADDGQLQFSAIQNPATTTRPTTTPTTA